jgi:hypothetical protein
MAALEAEIPRTQRIGVEFVLTDLDSALTLIEVADA